MKKALVAFTLTAGLVIPSASFASAESIVQPTANNQSEIEITYVAPNANDAFFSSQSTNPVIDRGGDNNSIITPMSTDGQNLFYEFKDVYYSIWTSSNLPIHRSGSISLTLVQSTGSWTNPATVQYQFLTKDGTKKSTAIQVKGNVSGTNTTIYFSDVPKGTSTNPVYLLITNLTPKNSNNNDMPVYGNGYTNG